MALLPTGNHVLDATGPRFVTRSWRLWARRHPSNATSHGNTSVVYPAPWAPLLKMYSSDPCRLGHRVSGTPHELDACAVAMPEASVVTFFMGTWVQEGHPTRVAVRLKAEKAAAELESRTRAASTLNETLAVLARVAPPGGAPLSAAAASVDAEIAGDVAQALVQLPAVLIKEQLLGMLRRHANQSGSSTDLGNSSTR